MGIVLERRSARCFSRPVQGQEILVTGGGTGLGRGMAERLLGLGAEIAICGRRKSVCDAAAEEMMKAHGGVVKSYGVDIRDAAAVEAMVEEIFREGPLTSLVNNAAGNFIARTEDLSPRGFDAIANIVMHGTFYVTQAVGKRWIAAGAARQRRLDRGDLGPQRRPVRRALRDEQGGGAGDDHVACERMGPLRHPPQRHRAGRNPDRGHEQAAIARRRSRGAETEAVNPLGRVGRIEELQNLAAFLLSDGCEWLTGETIAMDGAQALATGGNFYELRKWGDAEWRAAREAIEAQNARDRAQRG